MYSEAFEADMSNLFQLSDNKEFGAIEEAGWFSPNSKKEIPQRLRSIVDACEITLVCTGNNKLREDIGRNENLILVH